jgi:hypothetical protein
MLLPNEYWSTMEADLTNPFDVDVPVEPIKSTQAVDSKKMSDDVGSGSVGSDNASSDDVASDDAGSDDIDSGDAGSDPEASEWVTKDESDSSSSDTESDHASEGSDSKASRTCIIA